MSSWLNRVGSVVGELSDDGRLIVCLLSCERLLPAAVASLELVGRESGRLEASDGLWVDLFTADP